MIFVGTHNANGVGSATVRSSRVAPDVTGAS